MEGEEREKERRGEWKKEACSPKAKESWKKVGEGRDDAVREIELKYLGTYSFFMRQTAGEFHKQKDISKPIRHDQAHESYWKVKKNYYDFYTGKSREQVCV